VSDGVSDPDAEAIGADALRRAAAHVVVDCVGEDHDEVVVIDHDVEHHLRRVLRLRPGQPVTVTDLAGRWRSTVVAGSRERLQLEVSGDVMMTGRPARAITIAAAIPKGERLDWMVQKLTELGADRLVLLHAEHSATRWDDARSSAQRQRAERVSLEACRQSRRTWSMRIEGPLPALSVLPDCVVAEPGGRAVQASDDAIAVGPEGGWSNAELDAARGTVSLGANILRVETAAIAALTLRASFDH
jgi:16S rRNA (uracil1498-N3)-methyltransferase